MQSLLALQEIDHDLYHVQEELRRLPAERERRTAELERREKLLEGTREAQMALKVQLKELEDLAVVKRQRIRKLDGQANESRDIAVVEGCRYEMRELKRQVEEAERESLSLMERIEEADGRIAGMQSELDAERTVFQEYDANVQAELADAQRRHDELAALRAQRLSKDLDPGALSLYDRLLQARDGEAMARLDGRVCQACHMEVPPNLVVRLARGTDLIQCPSCDRILYT